MKKRLILLLTTSFLLLGFHSAFASGDPLVAVYRVYNSASQEHLYTPYTLEVGELVFQGWTDEGRAWIDLDPDDTRGIPVYRLYCHATGKHLYTTDSSEVESLVDTGIWVLDYNGEPIFRAAPDDSASPIIPVYRLYNPAIQTHILTIDQNEYNTLPSLGWRQEGIAFNAVDYQ